MQKTYSLYAAAEFFEKDRRTLTRALRDVKPDVVVKRSSRFKASTILNALIQHELKLHGAAVPGKITDEHLLLARARREKIELELAEQAGQLSHVDTVAQIIEEQYRNTREFFLSMPGSCSNDLSSIARKADDELSATILVGERLRQTLHQAMSEWSTPESVIAQAHARRHGQREIVPEEDAA
jgi:hypothetical protein